jgi:hypothetical protein
MAYINYILGSGLPITDPLTHAGHRRRIEFVGPSGPAFFRHQALEATLSELALNHVEMAPRETEIHGRLGDGSPLFFYTAQHLVLDSDQVFAIEESHFPQHSILGGTH